MKRGDEEFITAIRSDFVNFITVQCVFNKASSNTTKRHAQQPKILQRKKEKYKNKNKTQFWTILVNRERTAELSVLCSMCVCVYVIDYYVERLGI